MEFWGVEVKAGAPVVVDPEGFDKFIHLSQAVLGEAKNKASQPVILYLKIDDQKLVLGTLSHELVPQISFHLVLEKKFELSHNWKRGSVYFCGYKVALPREMDEDSEDEEAIPLMTEDNAKPDIKRGVAKAAASKSKDDKPADSKKQFKFVSVMKDVEDDASDDESDDKEDEDDSPDEVMLGGAGDVGAVSERRFGLVSLFKDEEDFASDDEDDGPDEVMLGGAGDVGAVSERRFGLASLFKDEEDDASDDEDDGPDEVMLGGAGDVGAVSDRRFRLVSLFKDEEDFASDDEDDGPDENDASDDEEYDASVRPYSFDEEYDEYDASVDEDDGPDVVMLDGAGDSNDEISEDDDETPPKKVDHAKKRPKEYALKTPVPAKKAKSSTPQKTDGKKGGHVATPYPLKKD